MFGTYSKANPVDNFTTQNCCKFLQCPTDRDDAIVAFIVSTKYKNAPQFE